MSKNQRKDAKSNQFAYLFNKPLEKSTEYGSIKTDEIISKNSLKINNIFSEKENKIYDTYI